MGQDWLDKLKSLRGSLPGSELPDDDTQANVTDSSSNSARLDIVLDKKGRAGKTATIIAGWNGNDDELLRLAADLKKKIGTGGSARGGEILIQGDRRQQILQLLQQMGYKARII